MECHLKSFCDQPLANTLNCLNPTGECVCTLCVCPPWTIHIRLQQHLRPTHLLGRTFELFDDVTSYSALRVRQANDVLLVPGIPSLIAPKNPGIPDVTQPLFL